MSAARPALAAWPPDAQALREIELVDARYPLTGASMWMPHGFSLARRVVGLVAAEFAARGFDRVTLPAIVPDAALEQQHRGGLGDFRGRVFYASGPWLGGMVLAPTVEGQISAIWADWLREGVAAPPLRIFCVRSIARYEPNRPRPMWNERFVWPFIEAQTGTLTPADQEIAALMAGSARACALAGLPVIQVERVRRPGSPPGYAARRLELVSLTPSGAVTTLSSVYDLGTRFSEAFDVTAGGRHLSMVNFACSSRLVLATVAHSLAADGMPAYHPRVAPVQVAVIAGRPQHGDRAAAAAAELAAAGVRARACAGAIDGQEIWAARLGAPIVLHAAASGLTVHVRSPGSEREVSSAGMDRAAKEIGEALLAVTEARERRCGAIVASMVSSDLSPDGAVPPGAMSRARLCADDRCLGALLAHPLLDVVGRPWPAGSGGAAGACLVCGREASGPVLVGRKTTGEK